MFEFRSFVHKTWQSVNGMGILFETFITIATPSEITESDLIFWLDQAATFEDGMWSVETSDFIVDCWDRDDDAFLDEVMAELNRGGVSISDRPEYCLENK